MRRLITATILFALSAISTGAVLGYCGDHFDLTLQEFGGFPLCDDPQHFGYATKTDHWSIQWGSGESRVVEYKDVSETGRCLNYSSGGWTGCYPGFEEAHWDNDNRNK